MRTSDEKLATECVSWRWNGNLGDDLIWHAQERLFAPRFRLGQYVDNPRVVLVGGGTFIPKFPEHPELLRLSRTVPTVFFGTGAGDPLFWGTEHIAEWLEILGNAQYVGVRGPLTRQRLEDWGVPASRIEVVGDVALYFAEETPIHRYEPRSLGVNLGVTYGKLYGFNEEALENAVIEALETLSRLGWQISLLCAWEPDDEVVNRLQSRVRVHSIRHWHDDFHTALREMHDFDVVLCEKLHIGVVAACCGVPFVALNYRSKVLDFCRTVHWERFCLGTADLTSADLVEHVQMLADDRQAYSANLHTAALEMKTILVNAAEKIMALFRSE